MKRILIFFVLVLIYGCAGRPTPIPEASSPEGELFSTRCGMCHSVPHPKRHTFKEWEHIIGVMDKEMKHRKMEPLADDEKTAILRYLERNAR